MGVGDDGRLRLRYDAPAEVGAIVEAALAEAKGHLFRALHASGAPGRVAASEAVRDAVLATRSLETGAADTPGRRSRYRVQVHLDTDGGWLTGRPRLPRGAVDGLTCDGTLTPVWETEGHPVNVGRSHRVVPRRTRVIVLDRDRGCRFPGCQAGTASHLEVHHLVHWRDGGPTDLANLLCRCTFHHEGHHRGEFTITGDPTRLDGLEFLSEHGLLIGPPATPPDPVTRLHPGVRPRSRLGRAYAAPAGEPLHLRLVDYTPPRAATPMRR